MNPIDLPQTPLQQSLQGHDAAAVLQAHAQRLQHLRRHLQQVLAAGLAPADYAQGQQLLAMCDAALRQLSSLQPAAAVAPTGPAVGLPRLPLPA